MAMSKSYLIGVDGGTESLRAGVFDTSGSPLAYASTRYSTQFPSPGWAEQDPNDWWHALGQSVRKAIKESGRRGGTGGWSKRLGGIPAYRAADFLSGNSGGFHTLSCFML